MSRELAKLVTIDSIRPHPNADRLELAIVGGWQVVVKMGEFKVGDKAVYLEIDSMVPVADPWFGFLTSNIEEVNGVKYSRIKTARIRKEISQGLLISIAYTQTVIDGEVVVAIEKDNTIISGGHDLSLAEMLGVVKYDPSASEESEPNDDHEYEGWMGKLALWLKGSIKTHTLLPWPSFIKSSEQERLQNLGSLYDKAVESGERFEVTHKLNGRSACYYLKDGVIGATGRNRGVNVHNVHWSIITQLRVWLSGAIRKLPRMIKKREWLFPKWKTGLYVHEDPISRFGYDGKVFSALRDYKRCYDVELALHGELCGPGIRGNPERLKEVTFFVYGITVLSGYCLYHKAIYRNARISPADMKHLWQSFTTASPLNESVVKLVPLINYDIPLPADPAELLEMADGHNFNKQARREGIVVRSISRDFSFKVISNRYLINNPQE